MSQKKRSTKKIIKNGLRNKLIIGAIIAIVVIGGSGIYYYSTKTPDSKNKSEVTTSEQQKETPKDATVTPPAESSKPEAPQVEKPAEPETQTPPSNGNVPEINQDSPKLTVAKVESIHLGMSEGEVKSLVGDAVFTQAQQAGQSLGSLTINVSDAQGGIVLHFEESTLFSIVRTYPLQANNSAKFATVKTGMSMSDVKKQLGSPYSETGKPGSYVYSYTFNDGASVSDKIIVFDSANNVQLVQ